MIAFPVALEHGGLVHRESGGGRKFLIVPGLFVADQTVHRVGIAEIEMLVFPAVTGVT